MSKGHPLKNVSVEFWRNMTQNAQWGYVQRLQEDNREVEALKEEIKILRDSNFYLLSRNAYLLRNNQLLKASWSATLRELADVVSSTVNVE